MNWFNALSLLLVTTLLACGDNPDPVTPEAQPPALSQITPNSFDPMDHLADRVPSFAGAYFNADGDFVVRIKRGVSNAETRASEVAQIIINERGPGFLGLGRADGQRGRVLTELSDYTFTELRRFQRIALALLDLPDAFLLDLDERQGRIVVNVLKEGSITAVFARAAELGLPSEILSVEVSEPVRLETDITETVRPTAGGLRIVSTLGEACTLGFIAKKFGAPMIVTNSHCSKTRGGGGGDGTGWRQVSGSVIAWELSDPAWSTFLPDCPVGFQCRWSDSTLGDITLGTSHALGKIKKTNSRGGLAGGKTIVGDFNITSVGLYPFQGQSLDKVGQATGWTSGSVHQTCFVFDLGSLDDDPLSGHAYVCQYSATYGSNKGDSGAPVFSYDGSDNVALYGIHWGRSATLGALISPMGNVLNDHGSLTLF